MPSYSWAAAVVTAIAGALPAWAEDTVSIPRITITATKVPRELQDVPAQVSVVGADELERTGSNTIAGVANLVPSLNLVNVNSAPHGARLMRGLGSYGWGDPTVGVFVDGIYVSADSEINADLLDIERVEVLRGPQNMLYGKSAIGGAINLVTREPSLAPERTLNYFYGDGERHRSRAGVSGPIDSDRLRFSATMFAEDFGGYERTVSGESADRDRTRAGRVALFAMPAETLTLQPSITFQNRDQRAYAYRRIANDRDYQGKPLSNNSPNDVALENTRISLRADWKPGPVDVASLTSFANSDEVYAMDPDYSNTANWLVRRDIVQQDIAQELRFSRQEKRLFWMTGLYYFHQDHHYTQKLWNGAALSSYVTDVVNKDTYSAFGRAEYKLTDMFTLIGGLRYDIDQRELTRNTRSQSMDTHHVTPLVGLSAELTPGKMLYASWTSAHKAGGYNFGNYPAFNKETIESFEVGAKTRWDRIVVNGALFQNDLSNQQTYSFDGATVSEYTTNAGNLRVQGVEVDGTLRLTPDLSLGASATALHAVYRSYNAFKATPSNANGTNVSLAGYRPDHVPRYQGVLTADWTPDLAPLGLPSVRGMLHMDWRAVGSQVMDELGVVCQSAYHLMNLSAGVRRDNWHVRALATNVYDTPYFTHIWPGYKTPLAGNVPVGMRGLEQHFGVEIGLTF